MDSRKLEELIVHLGTHPGVVNLGLTKLWKLIYFVDAKGIREFGESVTGSDFIKYEHGPVPSRGERQLRQLVRRGEVTTAPRIVGGKILNEVKSNREPDSTVFSILEMSLIETVCKELGNKSAGVLSELSHQEPAWHYARMLDKLSPELICYGQTEDPNGL